MVVAATVDESEGAWESSRGGGGGGGASVRRYSFWRAVTVEAGKPHGNELRQFILQRGAV